MKELQLLNKTLRSGGIFGALAVAFGALGAHALKNVLSPDQLNSFETAVKYQMYHAIAIIICGICYQFKPSIFLKRAYFLFFAGIIIFSGSIYLLSLKQWLNMPLLRILGPITPLGGLSLMAGWVMLILAAVKNTQSK